MLLPAVYHASRWLSSSHCTAVVLRQAWRRDHNGSNDDLCEVLVYMSIQGENEGTRDSEGQQRAIRLSGDDGVGGDMEDRGDGRSGHGSWDSEETRARRLEGM